ncbi:hypothetical protein IMCC26134_11190 [Verrucomicrobia bacterium IMCC26134]|jgi:hypothetical protein|nr:hypothetical protein IMCC26134_11190 [Verrucomicrobia bacterium IMCC26134]
MISLAYADASPDAQRRMESRLNSRNPFPSSVHPGGAVQYNEADRARIRELEAAIHQRDQEQNAREAALEELQCRLVEREREIAEFENLLLAREKVLLVQRNAPTMTPFAATAAEAEALEKLRVQLDAQEATIQEARAALKEREHFIEQSETTLMDKVTAQQEHEISLEQREENVRRAEIDLRRRLAEIDPAAAAEIEAERIKQRDEFNE